MGSRVEVHRGKKAVRGVREAGPGADALVCVRTEGLDRHERKILWQDQRRLPYVPFKILTAVQKVRHSVPRWKALSSFLVDFLV
jgi:hypothetical protein